MSQTHFYHTHLPPHLRVLKDEIEGYAREYGLDFYETIFEVVDAENLNEIAAYGGFPTRYPHWSFGMQFEELKKGYEYGLSKIYEMVINNDPCYAYLMRCNHTVDQKLVMAHVYGHCLAPETRVETRGGSKLITDVRVGDEVLTHNGRYRKVRLVARREYKGDICRLRVMGGEEVIRITPEHPVLALRPVKVSSQLVTAAHAGAELWQSSSLGMGWDDEQVLESAWVPAGVLVAGDTIEIPVDHKNWFPPGEGDERVTDEVHSVVRERYEGYVYNFSVEEDESYVLSVGMTVHNCDFFKHNAFFGHTTRKMMDEIANHAARIRGYVERFGEDEVEAFLDRCMSVDDLIDIHSVAIKRRDEHSKYDFSKPGDAEPEVEPPMRFRAKPYMEGYINPPETAEDEAKRLRDQAAVPSFPDHPEKDVLLFLIEHAPLKAWQRDILSIVRDEAYYFFPQGQTKIMNEGWACLEKCSLVLTDHGVLDVAEVVDRKLAAQVSDGKTTRAVTGWATFPNRETVRIRTRRGLKLAGSTTHRVLVGDGAWKRLDELRIGDRVPMAKGTNLWARHTVRLAWQPKRRLTLAEVAAQAGVASYTVTRHRRGETTQKADAIATALVAYEAQASTMTLMHNKQRAVSIPAVVDESFATFLGYLIGDGHISDTKRTLGLTTGDEAQADHFAELVTALFGIAPRKQWDETKWRVKFSSGTIRDFLVSLGLTTGFSARLKTVPDCILRSPKPVVAAFLRALYDCDGYAGKQGVILSTSSEKMGEVVQLLLLNFGILSSRRLQQEECWHVHTMGESAKVFEAEIGFGLRRKTDKLRAYLSDRKWFKAEPTDDEIVSVERGRADVYDFTVSETHRYVAGGFVNHNSFWHSTIMTQKALHPSELMDYADHHSGTMATSSRRLNPYKLGIELLRDVERRWDMGQFGPEWDECDDYEARRTWDRQTGLGRAKIFEVRKVHNDITFIDTFLTPEFCKENRLFSFAYADPTKNYVIESREFQQVKQRLLASLTNFGKPWIEVVNGNHRNRGELLLRHRYNGVELKLNEAQDTLVNLRSLWGRPVHLETVIDDKPTVLSFDGTDHTKQVIGAENDPRRAPAPKPK